MDRLVDFIASVRTLGMARSSKFSVEITLPRGMMNGFGLSSNMHTILLFCDSTSLPGANMSTTANRSFGESREIPYDRLFDSLNLSFYVDTTMIVKSFFDEWQNVIQNRYSRTFSYYEDYITKITVTVLDTLAIPRYRMELFEAYPKSIGAIGLDYGNRDIMKLNIGFTFKWWESVLLGPGPTYIQRPESDSILSMVVPKTYLDDFNGFQRQYAALSNPIGNPALYGDTQGIFTGTGGYG